MSAQLRAGGEEMASPPGGALTLNGNCGEREQGHGWRRVAVPGRGRSGTPSRSWRGSQNRARVRTGDGARAAGPLPGDRTRGPSAGARIFGLGLIEVDRAVAGPDERPGDVAGLEGVLQRDDVAVAVEELPGDHEKVPRGLTGIDGRLADDEQVGGGVPAGVVVQARRGERLLEVPAYLVHLPGLDGSHQAPIVLSGPRLRETSAHSRRRGSRTSRSPSPSRLNARTVPEIASDGQSRGSTPSWR